MKRIGIIIVVILVCLAGVGITWWGSDPAVHWTTVVTAFQGHFGRSDDGQLHDRSWIPWCVRNNPRRLFLDWKRSRLRLVMGFPNMDMGFHDAKGTHDIVLSVHLYENFARGITITCEAEDQEHAEDIQRMVQTMFPGLPLRIKDRNAQPSPAGDRLHPPQDGV
jgi:hypothetical protein